MTWSWISVDRNRKPQVETEVAEGLHDDRWFDRRVDPQFGACDLMWCPGFMEPDPRHAYNQMSSRRV